MNREIRFRAWDSTAGVMLYRTLFDRNWYSTPKNTVKGCNCIQGIKPRDCHMPTMQYTGLKDKNGVEIYFGDVVMDEGTIGEIKQLDGGAYYVNRKDTCLKYMHQIHCELCETDSLQFLLGCYEGWELEVIGNVFENPELLEASK